MHLNSTQIYNIYDLFWLKLRDNGLTSGLHQSLAKLRTDYPGWPCVELTLHRRSRNMSASADAHFSGQYKGIPWRVSYNRDKTGCPIAVHFHAPCFWMFLAVRFALIPLVRQLLIERGGFALAGTAFRWRGATWQLCGRPGVGKTHLLLEALSDSAVLVGDLELLVFRDGTIRPMFDQVEFRYATVRDTPYWQRLTQVQQWWLRVCRLISFVTRRRISFNLSTPPAQLGWPVVADNANARHIIVGLGCDQTDWNVEVAVVELMAYYLWYESIFDVVFTANTSQRDRQLAENLRRQVKQCDLVSLPSGASLQQLLSAKS